MDKQTVTGMLPPEWSHRLRGAQFGFIAGIVIGLIFGWIFHGIISMAFTFGLLLLLLLPLIVIGWLWFRSQRAPRPQNMDSQQQRAAQSWSAVIDVSSSSRGWAEEPTDVEFVDVPLIREPTKSTPDQIEADLEALKRERERGS